LGTSAEKFGVASAPAAIINSSWPARSLPWRETIPTSCGYEPTVLDVIMCLELKEAIALQSFAYLDVTSTRLSTACALLDVRQKCHKISTRM